MCSGSVLGLLLFDLLWSLVSPGFKCCPYAYTPKCPSQIRVSYLHFRPLYFNRLLPLRCLRPITVCPPSLPHPGELQLHFSISSGQLNWTEPGFFSLPHSLFSLSQFPLFLINICPECHQYSPYPQPQRVFSATTMALADYYNNFLIDFLASVSAPGLHSFLEYRCFAWRNNIQLEVMMTKPYTKEYRGSNKGSFRLRAKQKWMIL